MRRTLVILVEADLGDADILAPVAAKALRAYAESLERGESGNVTTDAFNVEVPGWVPGTSVYAAVRTVHGVDE